VIFPGKKDLAKGGFHALVDTANWVGIRGKGIMIKLKATSKNVIPAKAGIQKLLTSVDSRLRGSDKLIIIRGTLKE